MGFSINVSKHGTHFFATDHTRLQSERAAKEAYVAIRERFVPEDGYKVTVTEYHPMSGTRLNWENIQGSDEYNSDVFYKDTIQHIGV